MGKKERKAELIGQNQRHPKDTGTAGVQVALLTERIKEASEHMKQHPGDFHSQLGLLKMVGRRRRLLSYLKRTESQEYEKLVKRLELRK